MEAVELEQISTSIRSSMGETAGQFRQAASKSNEEIGKVVKDISRMFKAQREELNEIGNAIQDSVHQSETESAKIDRLAGIFEESVQIQNDMLTEMRKSSAGMKIVSDSIIQLNNNMMSTGPGGLLGALGTLNTSVGGIGGNIVNVLKGAGLNVGAGLAGGAVRTGAEMLIGAGGTGESYDKSNDFFESIIKAEGTASKGNPYNTSLGYRQSPKPLTEMTMKESLDWGEQIAQDEMRRKGVSRGSASSAKGAFQIVNSTQKSAMAALGMSDSELFNEQNQRKMAAWIAKTQGLGAWEGFKAHPGEREKAQQAMSSGMHQQTASTGATPERSLPERIVAGGKELLSSEGRGTATPLADTPKQAERVPSADVPRFEPMTGHGPLGGTAEHSHEQHTPVEKGTVTGKPLDGINPALSSSFLQAAAEFKQRTGETVNVNSAKRSTEEQQVLWDKKQRGEIRYPVAKPGTSLHEKGLAIDVPEATADKMDKMGILAKYGLNRPVANDPVHIQLVGTKSNEQAGPTMQEGGIRPETAAMPAPMAESISPLQAQPVAQQPAVTGPAMAGMNPMAMMGMMGGMMGGMMPGGMGGIIGTVAPMLMSAISSMQSPEAAATMESTPSTNVPAEMIQALSRSVDNTQMLSQAAINKQAQQETAQDPITETLNSIFGQQQNTPGITTAPTMAGSYDGYNGPSDIGWPDWAEMIGGNHWKEMKNYKKNMWG